MGDEGTVAHVCLLNLTARLDTDELSQQAVHHVAVVLRLICLPMRQQAQFHQLVVRHIVECKQVGTGFLYRVAIGFQGIGVCTRQQLSAAMSQAFVKVCVQVITDIPILFY